MVFLELSLGHGEVGRLTGPLVVTHQPCVCALELRPNWLSIASLTLWRHKGTSTTHVVVGTGTPCISLSEAELELPSAVDRVNLHFTAAVLDAPILTAGFLF